MEITRDSQSVGAITRPRPYESASIEEDAFVMKFEQLTFEVPPGHDARIHRIRVPAPPEPFPPADALLEERLAARLPRFVRAFLSMTLSKLLVFEQKYGWYRSHGYSRAEARDKAWWHAAAASVSSRRA